MLSRAGIETLFGTLPRESMCTREDSCFRGGFDGRNLGNWARQSMAHLSNPLGERGSAACPGDIL